MKCVVNCLVFSYLFQFFYFNGSSLPSYSSKLPKNLRKASFSASCSFTSFFILTAVFCDLAMTGRPVKTSTLFLLSSCFYFFFLNSSSSFLPLSSCLCEFHSFLASSSSFFRNSGSFLRNLFSFAICLSRVCSISYNKQSRVKHVILS